MSEAGSTLGAARTVGRVTSFDGEKLTVLTPTGKTQSIATPGSARVYRASEGTFDDVREGARVVFKYHVDSPGSAQEVIILPSDAPHGLPIIDLDEQWMTVKGAWGGETAVYLGYARFEVVTPVTLDDVRPGTIVYGFLAVGDEDALSAIELVMLPDDTTFGS